MLMFVLTLAALAAIFLTITYWGKPFLAWFVTGAVTLLWMSWQLGVLREDRPWWGVALIAIASGTFFATVLLAGLPVLRRSVVSRRVMKTLEAALPPMSETEKIALEAGTVWWDAELFSGRPNWRKMLNFEVKPLSEAEQAFLDGPVEELCALLDDFEVHENRDLPDVAWQFIKDHKFFGMIIPEEHGGLGFSGAAHSAVVTKISSRSVAAAVTVMVPNSLGPAELLLHYGTSEQKDYYLGRLARGEEVPCFALTEPNAGSDASSISSHGVVCYGNQDGEEVLGIRLNWNKRYITLAPIATVLGLAFQLRDPDQLLGEETDLGITCALIPTDLPGIEIGQRHDPLQCPFLNGPTQGTDVFVPLDAVIGGREMAGKGWLMLMQCLAAGRGISLPSLAVGAAQLATRTVGTYGNIREQFNVAIGAFEGVEERIARIAGLGYVMNSARVVTAASVDAGEKPAVCSAIVKLYETELMRTVVNDAMDVQAGAAICRGPRNVLAGAYEAIPVGITVEGANILTRTLIIYGQGAIRCHPYIHEQMEAIAEGNLKRFDRAFFRHVGFVLVNLTRAGVQGFTGGRCPIPEAGVSARYFARVRHLSAAFATLSDVTMGMLGGALKRKEKISGRFADALGWMYLCATTLKRFHDKGQPQDEEALVRWGCDYALYEVQQALLGILENFPNRFVAFGLRRIFFPLGPRLQPPSDALGAKVSRSLLSDPELLSKLSEDIFIPPADQPGLGLLDAAAAQARAAAEVKGKLNAAVKAGKLEKKPRNTLAQRGHDAGVITGADLQCLEDATKARNNAVQVDSFGPDGAVVESSELSRYEVG